MEKAVEIAAWFQKLFGNDYYIEIQNNDLEVAAGGDGRGRPGRQSAGHPAGRHQRRPLHPPRGRRGPGHPAVRQHGQVPHRHEPHADGDATSSICAAPRRCTPRSPAWTTPCAARRRSPTASTSSWSWASGTSPSTRRPTARRPRSSCCELCLDGLKERYADRPDRYADGEFSDEVMARLDRELGVINKLGFANYFLIVWDFVRFARAQGIPGHGPRLGRRLAGLLRAAPEPRLPAGVRSAVRAISRREPPRGARYRHRLLPAAPRRGDPVRQGQVRHGERGADRHVRHAGGPGGDPRRRPRAGPAHPARRCDRGPGARRTEASRSRTRSRRATT